MAEEPQPSNLGAYWRGGGASSNVFAWVNFNGTGTVAIRGAKNVSSITDNGAGNYTINFSEPAPDANYAVSVNVQGTTSSRIVSQLHKDIPPTETSVTVICVAEGTGLAEDPNAVMVTVFR